MLGIGLMLGIYCASGRAAEKDGWTPLFNGRNFDGWYTWLESSGKNSDPQKIFSIRDGAVHVYANAPDGTKQPQGYFSTESEYSNYRLKFQYRWGTKRFIPRAQMKRDAGLMYHMVGPDLLWPTCVECQVQETDTGDFVMVGTTLTVRLGPPSFNLPRYAAHGKPTPGLSMHVLNAGEYNDPPEDFLSGWNTVEVVVGPRELTHIVNGKVNNRGTDPLQPDPKQPRKWIPLTKGRILFQAEGAEVLYRDIRIKPLAERVAEGSLRPGAKRE